MTKKFSVKSIVMLAVPAVAVIAAIIIIIVFSGGNKVSVPNLVGRSPNEATALLKENYLEAEILYVFDRAKPSDTVISQNTEAGEKVAKGSTVTFTVNNGAEQVVVPDLLGKTLDEALDALTQLGFTSKIVYEYNDLFDAGTISGQNIKGGATADKGSEIVIVISKGIDLVTVPDFSGKTLEEATALAKEAGISLLTELKCSNTVKEGLLFSQSVAAGRTVKRYDSVKVHISGGKGGNAMGNSNSNALCHGNVTSQADWIYLVDHGDDHELYRIRKDGSDRQTVANGSVTSINVVDEWVYFHRESTVQGIYRVKLDGTDEALLAPGTFYWIQVSDGWIYFASSNFGGPVYRMKTDGSQKIQIGGAECADLNLSGDWIYYRNTKDRFIYKMRTDGSGKQLVCNKISAENLTLLDGYLYVTHSSTVYKINPKNGSVQEFCEDDRQKLFINSYNNTLYFIEVELSTGTPRYSICRMQPDGRRKSMVLTNLSLPNVNLYLYVADGWIYFPNAADNGRMYKVRTDGALLQKAYK